MKLQNILCHMACLAITTAAALPADHHTLAQRLEGQSPHNPAHLFDIDKRQTCPNDIHRNQQTTYYFKGTDPNQVTACGSKYNPNYMTAAISTELEKDIGGIKNACARQIIVQDAKTGNQIQLAIEDSNATGTLGKYALDVTPAAYKALGGKTTGNDPGQRTITWYLIDGVAVCF